MQAAPLHQLLLETARALAALKAGRSLTEALDACPDPLRAGTQALAFAAVRAHARTGALVRHMLPRAPQPVVEGLLRAALTQLLPGADAYPAHTLVNQAVQACKRAVPGQAALVNAVLRRFQREQGALLERIAANPEVAYEHPQWWIDALQRDWPAHWQALLQAAQQPPPLALRVNRRQGDAEAYAKRLADAGLQSRPLSALTPEGLVVEPPCPVQRLPGFSEGAASVQDGAAQLAAPLLWDGAGNLPPLPAGARLLDACAAPGGKTGHILECVPTLDLTALDQDAGRLERVRENLSRLRLNARLIAGNARRPADWWDGVPYDRILLDAPCSATGVIRRHPDIKLLRRDTDITALAREQQALLSSLWPLLRPGGRLLYATCSVLRQENEQVVAAFLASQPDAGELPIAANWGRALSHGRQILPGEADMDGFYYAVLVKPVTAGVAPCPVA